MSFRAIHDRAEWSRRAPAVAAPSIFGGGNPGNLHLVCGPVSYGLTAEADKLEGPR
jgi:hypothetical protein